MSSPKRTTNTKKGRKAIVDTDDESPGLGSSEPATPQPPLGITERVKQKAEKRKADARRKRNERRHRQKEKRKKKKTNPCRLWSS